MKLRDLRELIDQGQTAMLYSDNYAHNHHVYQGSEDCEGYTWADVDENGLLLFRTEKCSWIGILGRLPEAASSEWDAR